MIAPWRVHRADPVRADALAGSLGLHPITAQVLINRGVADAHTAARFLTPSFAGFEDPFTFSGMSAAAARFRKAAVAGEPVLIFSDSDTDGLTASVILYEALRSLGLAVHARHANRITDGYGLSGAFARELTQGAFRVVVLVDCGTNQPDEVRLLMERGIDVIIVDHHVPLERAAEPHALINPHCGGPGRGMCSAGLAFKVAQALTGGQEAQMTRWLDLAALGTLADCSPLVGENRMIVSLGLARIAGTRRPGMQKLCEAAGLSTAEPEAVIRKLVPKVNASGRLGEVSSMWRLMLEECDGRLDEDVAAVETAHGTTRQLHRQIMAEAQEQVNRLHFKDHHVLIVHRAGWHQGLMGPLASQLSQRYGRPAIALAMGDEQGTGSGRSNGFMNLFAMLKECRDLLVRFGGHAQACGLTIQRKDLDRFREALNESARVAGQGREAALNVRTVDLELSLGDLEPGWVGELAKLSPFGQGNPKPTVMLRRVTIRSLSARTGAVSDGAVRMAVRGRVPAVDPEGLYDVVASPGLAAGELVLTLGEARVSEARPEHGPTSDTRYRRARV
jgi:single-stranded-DNA-specific exonuclease